MKNGYYWPSIHTSMAAVNPILEFHQTELNMPFEIHTMDWIERNRHQQNDTPHRHNYFVIIWVKEARGTHLIDMEKLPLQNDTVYCITPGQVHLLAAEGEPEGYVISFTAEFLSVGEGNPDWLYNSGLFYNFSHASIIPVNETMQAEMEEAAGRMMKEFSNYFLLRSEILRGFLKIFLIYLTRQLHKEPQPENTSKSVELVRQFFAAMEKNYINKKMVTDYAEELVVTPNYLNEVVKKVTGFPVSHHIQQRIVLEAKRQAAYSNLSMKEIAYHLGFEDIPHFSKFFKNASGKSFTDFRKELAVQLGR